MCRRREGERQKILEEYAGRVGELLSGEVQQVERGKIVVMLNGVNVNAHAGAATVTIAATVAFLAGLRHEPAPAPAHAEPAPVVATRTVAPQVTL